MATVQIRNGPGDVHETYRRRAAAAGMSLQEYPTGWSSESSVDDVRVDRDAR